MDFKQFDQKTYQLIDRYLRGTMSDQEMVDFEIKMSLDPDLKDVVKLRELMIASIQHKRKEELKSFINRNSTIRFSGNIWGKSFTKLSAFIIIGTGLLLLLADPDDSELRRDADHPYRDPPLPRDTLNDAPPSQN